MIGLELQIKVDLFAELLGKCSFVVSNSNLFVSGSIHQGADRFSDLLWGRLLWLFHFCCVKVRRSPCHGGKHVQRMGY